MARHTFRLQDATGDARILARSAYGFDWNYVGDDEVLIFGNDSDVTVGWDSTNAILEVLPLADPFTLSVSGGVLSIKPTGAGLGYGAGAGGSVTQITSRATSVTLNKLAGKLTTTADSLAAATIATFTVTNSTVAVTDTIVLSKVSGDVDTHAWINSVAAGSFTVSLLNTHASAADTTVFVANFAVIKSVIS